LSVKNVFEALEITVRVYDCLEFLKSKLISPEHLNDYIFFKFDMVLFEQINALSNIKRARPITVKLGENCLNYIILLDLLFRHQILLFHIYCVFAIFIWLLKLVKLNFSFEPVFDLEGF
jgi:hypothetical protein